MSAITIENDLVHYEVLGRGRPVIFVHGWLGSWRYWVPTMQQLSMKYRTYALDLWGFGDSGKQVNRYGFKDQVRLLYDFMEKLGIAKAALVGHSLGAAICLRFASQYPERAPRVMLVSPPLFDLGGLNDLPANGQAAVIPAAPVTISPVPTPPTPPTPPAAQAAPAAPVAVPSPAVPVPASPVPTPTTAQVTPAVPAEARPVPEVVPSSAAPTPASPVPTPTTAQVTPATPAEAKPVPEVVPSSAAPVPAAPAAQATPAAPAEAKPVPVEAPAPAAPVPAAPGGNVETAANPPADSGFSASETLPRNPLRALGNTPEEILAALQARNVSGTSGVVGPARPAVEPASKPLPPAAPSLPINIGTPILPKTSPLAPPTPPSNTSIPSPVPSALAQPEVPNPLVSLLSGIKPGVLLIKHVDRDAPDLDKLRAEVEKTDEIALTRSAQSFTGVNLAVELHHLTSPTLLLHGQDDPLIPPPNGNLIRKISQGKPDGHLLAFIEPDLRHFPMLEITAKFNRLLMDFLDAQDLTNVQFKDQWIRIFR